MRLKIDKLRRATHLLSLIGVCLVVMAVNLVLASVGHAGPVEKKEPLEVPFAEHLKGSYSLEIPAGSEGRVHLLKTLPKLDAALPKPSEACYVDVGDAAATEIVVSESTIGEGKKSCTYLYTPQSADGFSYFLYHSDKHWWRKVTIQQLPGLGDALEFSLKVEKGPNHKLGAWPALPNALPANATVYFWFKKQLLTGSTNASRELDKALKTRVQQVLSAGDEESGEAELIFVDGAGHVFKLGYEVKPKRPTPGTDPAAELRTACGSQLALEKGARGGSSSLPAYLDKRQNRVRRRRAALSHDWFYLVCIDYTDPQHARRVVLTSVDEVDPRAPSGHLFANQDVVVVVFRKEGVSVGVELTVDRVARTQLYDGTAAPKGKAMTTAAELAAETPSRFEFGPRGGGGIGVIKVTGKKKTTTYRDVTFPIEVERAYRGALRLGAAVYWAPWYREYGVRTASSGGNEIYIKDGEGGSHMGVDATVGYSVFFPPIRHNSTDVSFSLFAGVGALSSNNGNVQLLGALLYVAPELNIGKNFSVGVAFSLRRAEKLRGELSVGRLVASSTADITQFSVSPAFGVLINLSPRFWTAIGRSNG